MKDGDDFDGPITPRPVTPVGFTLAQDWEQHRSTSADRSDVEPVCPSGDHMGDIGPTLTKHEAIFLAKLIVAYPFLRKVL